jgi:predicted kinase
MTSATTAGLQRDPSRRSESEQLARGYLEMALQLLHPAPPCLIAVGGLSGTGKSTLAQGLAPSVGPVPGAVIIRSDDVRKRLCGVGPLQRLGPEGYTSEVSRRVYEAVVERATVVVRGGHAAIADAVFARPSDRESIEQTAAAAGVPFAGIWLTAPETALLARIEQRHRDPSDADAEVIRAQLAQDPGPSAWQPCEASGTSEEVHRRAIGILEDRLGRGILDAASRATA